MRIAAFMENISQIIRESGKPASEILAKYSQEGLDSVYMNYSSLQEAGEEQTIEMFRNAGLTLEGLWENISFNLLDDAEADTAYRNVIDCAKRNGAEHILITPGFFHEGYDGKNTTREEIVTRDSEIQKMISAMKRAKEYGDSVGIHVTMEDYDWFSSPIAYPDVLRRFFEEIPGLECCFDTGNFIPCDADVMEAYEYYKDKIYAVHLKDRVLNNDQSGKEKEPYTTLSGKKYYPASVGSGDMHVKEILDDLKNRGCNCPGIIELFMSNDLENKLSESIKWLKNRQ